MKSTPLVLPFYSRCGVLGGPGRRRHRRQDGHSTSAGGCPSRRPVTGALGTPTAPSGKRFWRRHGKKIGKSLPQDLPITPAGAYTNYWCFADKEKRGRAARAPSRRCRVPRRGERRWLPFPPPSSPASPLPDLNRCTGESPAPPHHFIEVRTIPPCCCVHHHISEAVFSPAIHRSPALGSAPPADRFLASQRSALRILIRREVNGRCGRRAVMRWKRV